MIISELYKKYQINKGLQEHMIRVAAVAKQICDTASVDLDMQSIVDACLLHDMGNLIKAVNMEQNSYLFEPEGVAFWKERQAAMCEKYSNDVEAASDAIVIEIGVPESTFSFYKAVGNGPTQQVCHSGSLSEKITNYSDMRVGIDGVITLAERIDDMRIRYSHRGTKAIDQRSAWLNEIEASIFSHTTIAPNDISDESTKGIQAELWNWEIKTTT